MKSFDSLKGIGSEKEVNGGDENPAINLLEMEKLTFELYFSEWEKKFLSDDEEDEKEYMKKFYTSLDSSLKIGKFDEKDLESYLMMSNGELFEDHSVLLRGIYSGYLLTLLTRRNREENKSTSFYFNGHGKEYHCLFCCAKDVDSVIIDNFCGDAVGTAIGGFGGNANSILFYNCKGDGLGVGIGSEGNCGLVSFVKCEGESMGVEIGIEGKIGVAFASNCKGFDLLGSGLFKKGKAGVLWVTDNESENTPGGPCLNEGKLGIAYFKWHTGNINENLCSDEGKIEHLFIDNPPSTYAISIFREPKIKRFYLNKQGLDYSRYMLGDVKKKNILSVYDFQKRYEWKFLRGFDEISVGINEGLADPKEIMANLSGIYSRLIKDGMLQKYLA